MKLKEAIRHTVLAVARREGGIHPQLRVTLGRKTNKATISLAVSGTADLDAPPRTRRAP
jgi:hypothetical protein